MDTNYLSKKEKLYAAERAKIQVFGNEAITSKELLDSYKAIEVAKADLEGKVQGFVGWERYEAEVVLKHAASYPREKVEWAHSKLGS